MKNILIKNGFIYSPQKIGKKDILLIDGRIQQIDDEINISDVEIINADGKIICPAFIDGHQHIASDLEVAYQENINAGITTSVLLFGGNRNLSIKTLLNATEKFQKMGLFCYCLTGGFYYPPNTLTGSVILDIEDNEKIIGTKTALNSKTNMRQGNPTYEEFKQLALDTYRASSKKKTHLHVHLERCEPGADNLEWIDKIVEETNIPYSLFKLTHVSKVPGKILSYAKKGCVMDFTAVIEPYLKNMLTPIAEAIKQNDQEILSNLTISSDAFGLLRKNKDDVPIYGEPRALQIAFRCLVNELGLKIEDVLPFFTTNVSKSMWLETNEIAIGKQANLLILNNNLTINKVIIKEKIIPKEKEQGD